MTFKEFITKWTDKPVDFDGIYPNQCMDLMHQYVYEVLEIKDKGVLAAPAAKLVWENFRWGDDFEKISNTPNGVPEKGDIVVFGDGEFGHISMFIEGNVNRFTSFDANWPVGSLPHKQEHDYNGVLGWLRPLEEPHNEEVIWQDKFISLNQDYQILVTRFDDYKKEISESDKIKMELLEKMQTALSSFQNVDTTLVRIESSMDRWDTVLGNMEKLIRDQSEAFDKELSVVKGIIGTLTGQLDKEKKKSSKYKILAEEGIEAYSTWDLIKAMFGA